MSPCCPYIKTFPPPSHLSALSPFPPPPPLPPPSCSFSFSSSSSSSFLSSDPLPIGELSASLRRNYRRAAGSARRRRRRRRSRRSRRCRRDQCDLDKPSVRTDGHVFSSFFTWERESDLIGKSGETWGLSDSGEEGEDLGEKGKRVPMLEVSPGSFKPKGNWLKFWEKKARQRSLSWQFIGRDSYVAGYSSVAHKRITS